ncbi:uncharacterized protein ACA1_081990 [Acanthamoeba castellanii str. Neff]|uniref:Uncharacterized protein n=1 Tax=Acanthamoeba castellanii (strain ATCC 30010 / Neff) TaxID=1257118 RepID=L8HD63_ACACF|nr:uncharacterized protein ACA1_081990 [Acanthamoeba castellanii str. Neff]ELR22698.1 hypothetical protein ACA1_081990 [Acanthamoeba castellanii str. Neff]
MEMNPSTSVTGKRPREEEVATNGKGSENGNAEAKVSKIEENTTPHQQLSVAVRISLTHFDLVALLTNQCN